ncbi:hypothetical protein C8Q79DRAFT_692725 [Trametes meyenii]|nr:hypothetical protein C8Q79DRAFT_692725 [Trametes meyenii]
MIRRKKIRSKSTPTPPANGLPSSSPEPPRTPEPVPFLVAATREEVSQHAMIHSITTGTFEDVKFYLFSRRTRSGTRVDTPRPLFANSSLICKASPHFELVFSTGFAESGTSDMDAPFPRNRAAFAENYDYLEDSDLDDDPGDVGTDAALKGNAADMKRVTIQPTAFAGPSALLASSEPENALMENTAEDRDNTVTDPKSTPVPSSDESGGGGKGAVATTTSAGRKGRVVFVEDFAYRTWEAFIFYAYFGRVTFAPLRSQEKLYSTVRTNPFEPPPCSPKSMYRLAEKYGVEHLKALALEDLGSKMTTRNILVELFSPFTVTYNTVQAAELRYLHSQVAQEDLLQDLARWLGYLEEGKLPRGSAAIFHQLLLKNVRPRAW